MEPQQGRDRRPFLARRLADDGDFRLRVEAADRLGIPGTELDGRQPATVTEYEYDTAGRLIRSVATADPRWTEQDRAEALALGLYREGLCPLCGGPREMCGAPEGTYRYEPVWEVCQATRVRVEKQNAVYKPDNYPYRGAHLWGARRIGGVP